MHFYDLAGRRYLSRVEAVRVPDTCYYYYYDHVFSKLDWTVEPAESLVSMYKRRAQQIRDTYDYVVLAYSGGYDSTNILETFYYNGIHVDELLMVGAFSQDKEKNDANHNADLYYNAFPTLAKLGMPLTKKTVVDYTESFADPNSFSIVREMGDEYFREIGSYYSPHNLFWRDVWRRYEGKGRVALIFGSEKPLLGFDGEGRYYAEFEDASFTAYGNWMTAGGVDKVFFYTTPDMPELTVKMHHALVNFHREHVGKTIDRQVFGANFRKVVAKIVYPLKNEIVHVSPKSSSHLLSLRDAYLINKSGTPIYDLYRSAMKKLTLELKGRYSPFATRRYYIT